MKLLFKLAAIVSVLLASIVAILVLAVDLKPSVNRPAEIAPANIEHAEQILRANDPRHLRSGEAQTIVFSEKDLDLAANYAAQQYAHGSARVSLDADAARITASVRIPHIPYVLYANLDATLIEDGALPRLERVRIGLVPLPATFAARLLARTVVEQVGHENFDALSSAVKHVSISDKRLAVTYEWQSTLEESIRSAVLPLKERERMKIYQERLYELSRAERKTEILLAHLLSSLFELAEQRSHDRDPVAENRAALLILAFYVNERELDRIVPEAKHWPRPLPHTITVHGREDYSRHFMVSAILAARAGGPVSDAIGVYKELADVHTVSGFSFDDIAAGRAGTLFGQKAGESMPSARRLQAQVAIGINDDDILPVIEDLRVSMTESEFKRRFGGVDTARYHAALAEIERRLAKLTLYR
jgi:hypothetical protein